MYFDPEKNQYKGDIMLGPYLKAELVSLNEKKFNIVTPKRSYLMKEIENDP